MTPSLDKCEHCNGAGNHLYPCPCQLCVVIVECHKARYSRWFKTRQCLYCKGTGKLSDIERTILKVRGGLAPVKIKGYA